MRPLSAVSAASWRAIRGVLCDIDDTVTTDGQLTAAAYDALARLHAAGLKVIPITGRPAGWCDHIARMWPVDAVVGENGAFWFRYDREKHVMHRQFIDPPALRARHRAALTAIADEILSAVPGTAIAADQHYRETDLAIDFCEDVPRLPDAAVQCIVDIMHRHGLIAKISSIHVNGWFGNYDKLATTRALFSQCFGIDLDAERAHHVFVGDSPNDAPMFGYFPLAVGVANIRDFSGRLAHEPAYVTNASAGAGFVEFTNSLLEARQKNE